MHPPVKGPRLSPSHDSPASMWLLPHFGFSMQELVSSWHVEEHFKVPPVNVALSLLHEFMVPNLLPSQLSPGSSWPFPQSGIFMHSEVSSLQFPAHFKVPPIKFVKSVQLSTMPKVLVSHSSPA